MICLVCQNFSLKYYSQSETLIKSGSCIIWQLWPTKVTSPKVQLKEVNSHHLIKPMFRAIAFRLFVGVFCSCSFFRSWNALGCCWSLAKIGFDLLWVDVLSNSTLWKVDDFQVEESTHSGSLAKNAMNTQKDRPLGNPTFLTGIIVVGHEFRILFFTNQISNILLYCIYVLQYMM